MVMNYPHEIQAAYDDYQLGKMGRPWDHELDDEKWLKHVQRFPCQYQYKNVKRKQKEAEAMLNDHYNNYG